MPRYVFVTGGVASSLGKGLAAAALGALLQARGYRVRLRKLDPYLNVDPGTMSPYQHGEVFVTDDGAETDLDLGHYERFTGVPARQSDNVTSGRIYRDIIAAERQGEYLGATVQVIPHVTDAIQKFIEADVDGNDFVLCEIGGTVGDIEGQPFLEAIRQLANRLGPQRACFVHLTLVPFISAAGQLKTKPTQHSVKELRSIGIQPDILVCRSDRPIPEDVRRKISLFCNTGFEQVVPALDVETIYDVPLRYHEAGLDDVVLRTFGIRDAPPPNLAQWREIVEALHAPEGDVTIAVVGKYTGFPDAYKSLGEALVHGGIANRVRPRLRWLDAEVFSRPGDSLRELEEVDGILVPGGFGERGTEGKIAAAGFARRHRVPYLGICLGMQMAVIEAARSLAGIEGAGSSEFPGTRVPVVGLLTEWMHNDRRETRTRGGVLGGTMRLGEYPCELTPDSRASEAYGGRDRIFERHRHRYEIDIRHRPALERAGLAFSGLSPDGVLPEIVEIPDHPWFMGVQFHPELKSKPFAPHPLFASFVRAAVAQSRLV